MKRISRLILLLMLIAFGCEAMGGIDAKAPTSEENNMTTNKEKAGQIVSLPDAEFFSFNEDKQLALQEALSNLLDDGGGPGAKSTAPDPLLAIGAPKLVHLDERQIVPVLLGHMESGMRAWQVNYATNLHVFVRNLSTGDFFIAQPLVDMRRGELQILSGAGDPPDGLDANMTYSAVDLVDLQAKLDGRLAPGRYMLTSVAYDLISNSVPMRLVKKDTPPIARMRYPQPYVRHTLVDKLQIEKRFDIPEKASVDDTGFISAALQLQKGAGVLKNQAGEAFWSGALILLTLDEQPVIVPVTTPVAEVTTAQGASVFNAVFQVVLRDVAKMAGAGNYLVYMDAGMDVLGPYPLTITQ